MVDCGEISPQEIRWSHRGREATSQQYEEASHHQDCQSHRDSGGGEKEETSKYIRFAFRARPVPSRIETLLGRGFPHEKKCNAVANSPNDDSQGITVGRKKEGVAILWNSQLDTSITPHKYEYDWVSIEIAL